MKRESVMAATRVDTATPVFLDRNPRRQPAGTAIA
jgi:hypothetical protein